MLRCGVLLLAGMLGCAPLHAQDAAAGPQEFEAATLKMVPGEHGAVTLSTPGDHQFRAVNVPLTALISLAYDIPSSDIHGLPKPVENAVYTVVATPPGDAGVTYAQLQAPLQKLLTERLHLAVHTESAEKAGYRLVAADGGLKLKASAAADGEMAYIQKNAIRAKALPLDNFANLISYVVEKPVENGTGNNGKYDVDLHFSRMDDATSDLPSVFTALQEQYGLKLVPAKVKVKVLMVDHVDAEPAAD